jgi:rhodanese-related sulfurtransferase
MSLKKISAADAKTLLDQGAVLVDIREPGERARVHVAGSKSVPFSRLMDAELPRGANAVIFHCTVGRSTTINSEALAAKAPCVAYELEGGLHAWQAAGLPVIVDPSQPIEILRQVQIAAGSLVLLGLALGIYVSPLWYGLAGFIGAGLVFSGASGSCAMAHVISLMPWNRVPS